MKILILGASGLVGSALLKNMLDMGYSVRAIARNASGLDTRVEYIQADLSQWVNSRDWDAVLTDVEIVINAVGIFSQQAQKSFAALHEAMPRALFAACEQSSRQGGVRRVIQISALGADIHAATEYWRSKAAADAALCASQLDWAIVRPSLIYAPNGRSCQQFLQMATWPVLPDLHLSAAIQPVHLDDVVAAILGLLTVPAPVRQVLELVGPKPYSVVQWLAALRAALGLPVTKQLRVSTWMQYVACYIGQYVPNSLLSPASLCMLRSGNIGSCAAMIKVLGREPKPALPEPSDYGLRQRSQLAWLLPLLRSSVALVWLLTAAICWWAWPREQSLHLLAQVGIPPAWQYPLFISAVAVDVLFGVACLLNWRWWRAQALLIMGYSAVIAIALPEFLWHPFGPVLKNLPILALCLLLDQCDQARRG